MIGFHWPSYDELASGIYYATSDDFPPTAYEGSIRDNINGSRAAFSNLLAFLREVQGAIPEVKLSLICHSEGNYMAMLGFLGSTEIHFEHVLLLAADINNAALQIPGPQDIRAGWGSGIARSAAAVTVYHTGNDDVLPISLYAYEKDYHNLSYGSRLGSAGPNYNQGPQAGNVFSVDCASVINVANFDYLTNNGYVPGYADGGNLSMHSSYLYIPQVVRDMGRVIVGVPPQEIRHRTANAWPGSYTMTLDNSHDEPGSIAGADAPPA